MGSSRQRLFIIDAMAMAFRNYHAFGARPLTTAAGIPTGAIFGCLQFMLRLMEDEKPDFVVVATDVKDPTFRHQMYPAYKAHRTEMPDDLSVQIPNIFRLFGAMGIPVIRKPGFEADDIIGSLVTRESGKNVDCFIVSGDKDFMQLITDHVFLYAPRKGEKPEVIGCDGVMQKFGCRPAQVVDILSIIGDVSDNVPGVRGIGEKGAASLIHEYGSLEGVYANLDQISNGRHKTALMESRENAFLSQKLVKICCEVDIDLELSAMLCASEKVALRPELLELCREFEFRTLVNKLQNLQASHTSLAPTTKSKTETEPGLTADSESDLDAHSGDISGGLAANPTVDLVQLASGAGTDLQTENRGAKRPGVNYQLINTSDGLRNLLQRLGDADAFSMDTETTGLNLLHDVPIGMSFGVAGGTAFYLPLVDKQLSGLTADQVRGEIREFLAGTKSVVVGHNLKFDFHMLANVGILAPNQIADTMIGAYLLDSLDSHGLDHCCLRYLGITKIPTSDLIGAKGQIPMLEVDLERICEYACEDADMTFRLFEKFQEMLRERELLDIFWQIEMPLLPVLLEMERRGVFVDPNALSRLSDLLAEKSRHWESETYSLAGEEFNINSTKQLQDILFEKLKIHEVLGLKRLKKTKTGYSTDVSVLESMSAHPLPRAILEYRSVYKLKNTYVDTLPQLIDGRSGRLHTRFHQNGTATGRLSSTDPNLQNIPIRTEMGREIRRAFTAQHGDRVIISADYSQVELRILAHLSQDAGLIEAFKAGADIHRLTAAKIFGIEPDQVSSDQRAQAKAINFGIIYGMGPQRLARDTGVSNAEAKEFIEKYFASYPGIRTYIDSSIASARKLGYSKTIVGRRRPIRDILSANRLEAVNAENIAVNSPVQGSAADLIKIAMIKIENQLKKTPQGGMMVLQVHDELLFECPKDDQERVMALVKYEMENALKLAVPLVVDVGVGANWLEAH